MAVLFQALLVSITAVLIIAYASFLRMNPEVRRARLWLMASRIHRFLLAFILGFLAIVVTFIAAFAGVGVPPSIAASSVFFFLGAILYGSTEILLIAQPVRNPLRARWRQEAKTGR